MGEAFKYLEQMEKGVVESADGTSEGDTDSFLAARCTSDRSSIYSGIRKWWTTFYMELMCRHAIRYGTS